MVIESGFAKLIVVLALATVSLFGSALQANELTGSRPNIILVMTDDQGMGDLSCMGNEIVKTPNIDQFFRQSTRFTDFQVNPTCAPTRSATCAELTGATVPENAGEDSVSFVAALDGNPIESTRQGVIHHSINGNFSYRQGKWKLLLSTGSGGWTNGKTSGNSWPAL